jgi:hypothetical protein
MNTIEVRPIPWVGYPTLEAALAAGQRSMADSYLVSDRVGDNSVNAFLWDDENVYVVMSLHFLHINVAGRSVTTTLRGGAPPHRATEHSAVLLQFPTLTQPVVWNRPDLALARVRDRLVRVFPSDNLMFVYFEKSPILLFQAFLAQNPTRPLLYWDDAD